MNGLSGCTFSAGSAGVVAGIPKRIIQTAKSAELPLIGQAARANAQLLNSDFDYCFFDNSQVVDFIREEFPHYMETFIGFPHPIQRYDFFRYLAVYRLGGFYLDTDVFLAKGLSPLLGLGCVFPFEELTLSDYLRVKRGMDWELGNYAFGAEAGHPFIKAVIDNCVKIQEDAHWADPMLDSIPKPFRGQFVAPITTGPGSVTRALADNPDLHPTVAVLFPEDVCDDETWHRFGDYGIHLMQASWRNNDGFLRTRIARVWERRRRSGLLAQSRRLGPYRLGRWKTIAAHQKNNAVALV